MILTGAGSRSHSQSTEGEIQDTASLLEADVLASHAHRIAYAVQDTFPIRKSAQVAGEVANPFCCTHPFSTGLSCRM